MKIKGVFGYKEEMNQKIEYLFFFFIQALGFYENMISIGAPQENLYCT